MSRKVFDVLASTGGRVLVVVLLVAGGLLSWGHSFVNSNVHSQLARQDITFPSRAAFAHPKPGSEISIMLWGAIASFVLAVLMLGLAGFGFAHARSTAPDERMLGPKAIAVVPGT